jgi:VIT1/CCC1 family predicted Fe2+/Mn2+ transporter
MRDELGILGDGTARPVQAALVSAAGFVLGAAPAVLLAALVPSGARIATLAIAAVALLAGVGVAAARLGGAPLRRAALRVALLGTAAMAISAGIGAALGTAV